MRVLVDLGEDDVDVVASADEGRAHLSPAQLPPGAGEGPRLRMIWGVEAGSGVREVAKLNVRL